MCVGHPRSNHVEARGEGRVAVDAVVPLAERRYPPPLLLSPGHLRMHTDMTNIHASPREAIASLMQNTIKDAPSLVTSINCPRFWSYSLADEQSRKIDTDRELSTELKFLATAS
jgi:hypothetical protein